MTKPEPEGTVGALVYVADNMANAINNVATAIHSAVAVAGQPTGVREEELDLDRRVGSAVRHLVSRGADRFAIKSDKNFSWGLRVYVGDTIEIELQSSMSLVDALEHAARHWPG
jgi:hypothetical protein